MACKACHPVKKARFIEGNYYRHDNGDDYICARVGVDRWVLVCLRDGNRWTDPARLTDVGGMSSSRFTELKKEK